MKKSKKAQGLPITTIVIAALGLLILVLLMWISGGKLQQFGKGVREETGVKACPGAISAEYECDRPYLGMYADNRTGQMDRIPDGEICCYEKPQEITFR